MLDEYGPCPVFAGYTLAFALQLRKKHGKPSVRVAEECQPARWRYMNIYQPFKRRVKSHLSFASIIWRFNVHGSLHCKYIPIYIQQDATLHSLLISGNCSTCFGWYFHPSSGAHTTVSTASGICRTVTAICRYHGRVGTGLSVLWVASTSIRLLQA
jgi:hypothetical protein